MRKHIYVKDHVKIFKVCFPQNGLGTIKKCRMLMFLKRFFAARDVSPHNRQLILRQAETPNGHTTRNA